MTLRQKLIALQGLQEGLVKGIISYGTYLALMYEILNNK